MYRYNGGKGAVFCDNCHKLIDINLSYTTYQRVYGKNGDDGDICTRCKRPEAYKNKPKLLKADMGELADPSGREPDV